MDDIRKQKNKIIFNKKNIKFIIILILSILLLIFPYEISSFISWWIVSFKNGLSI